TAAGHPDRPAGMPAGPSTRAAGTARRRSPVRCRPAAAAARSAPGASLHPLPGVAAALQLQPLALLDLHRDPGAGLVVLVGDDRLELAGIVLVSGDVAVVRVGRDGRLVPAGLDVDADLPEAVAEHRLFRFGLLLLGLLRLGGDRDGWRRLGLRGDGDRRAGLGRGGDGDGRGRLGGSSRVTAAGERAGARADKQRRGRGDPEGEESEPLLLLRGGLRGRGLERVRAVVLVGHLDFLLDVVRSGPGLAVGPGLAAVWWKVGGDQLALIAARCVRSADRVDVVAHRWLL